MAYDETLADRIRAALRGQAGLSEKLMFGGIAFLLNGNMIVGVARDRLMVRFDPARHDEVLRRPGAEPMDFTRRSSSMRGMVFVQQHALASELALASWIELAAGFVRRLPAKEAARAAATSKTRPLPRPAPAPDTKPVKRPPGRGRDARVRGRQGEDDATREAGSGAHHQEEGSGARRQEEGSGARREEAGSGARREEDRAREEGEGGGQEGARPPLYLNVSTSSARSSAFASLTAL